MHYVVLTTKLKLPTTFGRAQENVYPAHVLSVMYEGRRQGFDKEIYLLILIVIGENTIRINK